jgi:hypothetical protein
LFCLTDSGFFAPGNQSPAAAAESITMDQVLAAIHALYQSEHNVDNTSRR